MKRSQDLRALMAAGILLIPGGCAAPSRSSGVPPPSGKVQKFGNPEFQIVLPPGWGFGAWGFGELPGWAAFKEDSDKRHLAMVEIGEILESELHEPMDVTLYETFWKGFGKAPRVVWRRTGPTRINGLEAFTYEAGGSGKPGEPPALESAMIRSGPWRILLAGMVYSEREEEFAELHRIIFSIAPGK